MLRRVQVHVGHVYLSSMNEQSSTISFNFRHLKKRIWFSKKVLQQLLCHKHKSVYITVVNVMGHWPKNNITHYVLVGKIGQGKNSTARTEPTDRITHQMRAGQAHDIMPKGMPNDCTARWAWFTHLCSWEYPWPC